MNRLQLMSDPSKTVPYQRFVLDPFLGRFHADRLAARRIDRRGIELDPKFVDCIVKRYIECAGGKYDDVFCHRERPELRFDEVLL
jgi:hypothetical protein